MASFGLTSIGYPGTGNIFAGLHGPVEVKDITILSGEGALTEGTLLAVQESSGKYVKYDDTVTDGTEAFKGILGCDVDATSTDVSAFMYVHGEFNLSELSAVNTVTAGMYLYGSIIIKEEN